MQLPGIVSVMSVDAWNVQEGESHFTELESDEGRTIAIREVRNFVGTLPVDLRMMPWGSFEQSDHMT